MKVSDNGDGTFKATYTPDDLGQYKVNVKYGGKEVPQAPFNVQANPTGKVFSNSTPFKSIATILRLSIRRLRAAKLPRVFNNRCQSAKSTASQLTLRMPVTVLSHAEFAAHLAGRIR